MNQKADSQVLDDSLRPWKISINHLLICFVSAGKLWGAQSQNELTAGSCMQTAEILGAATSTIDTRAVNRCPPKQGGHDSDNFLESFANANTRQAPLIQQLRLERN